MNKKRAAREMRQRAAFQALIEAVSYAPLVALPPVGYLYSSDKDVLFSREPIRDELPDDLMAVYARRHLQEAFAMGRAEMLEDRWLVEKNRRRADEEYRSWRSSPRQVAHSSQAQGELSVGPVVTNNGRMNEENQNG